MRLILGIILLIVVIAYSWKTIWKIYLRTRCTATAPGRFVYANYRTLVCGRYFDSAYVPVYEYQVDGKVYQAEIEWINKDPHAFMGEVEVEYDPQKPTTCFILNMYGTMMFKQSSNVLS
ncbi:MAG: hypothetical protein K5678_06125 [Acetatifactor sp.]|nr:hypothetical protein [Acetatifactor sp.]